jgi:hypothetical protein
VSPRREAWQNPHLTAIILKSLRMPDHDPAAASRDVPDYVLSADARQVRLKNWKGETYVYPQPAETDCSCPYEAKWFSQVR